MKKLLIERLSLFKGKKPEYIERLIAKKKITDIQTLATKLRIDRREMYRKIIEPIRDKSKSLTTDLPTDDSH